MLSLRSKTALKNWTDLVAKLSESIYNKDVNSLKMWFEEHYLNPLNLESGFAATFNSTASVLTNDSSTSEGANAMPTSEGASAVNEISERARSSAGADLTVPSLNSGRELLSINSKKLKVSTQFKDTLAELECANLQFSEGRRSKRLNKDVPVHEDSNIAHALLTIFLNPLSKRSACDSLPLKSFLQRIFYAKKKLNALFDNFINHVSEFVLAAIDNEACSFKEMLKQDDRADFVTTMEKKVDAHEHRNHWKNW